MSPWPTTRGASMLVSLGLTACLAASCASTSKVLPAATTLAVATTATAPSATSASSTTPGVPTTTSGSCAAGTCATSMQMEVRSSGVDRTLHCVDPDTSGLCTADYRTGGIEVRLDFHNTAAVAQPVNLSGLQLETSDGQLHGYSPIAQVAGSSGGTHDCNPSTDGSIPSLAPGGVLSNIRVCFAVPPRQSAGPLQLRYQEQDPAPTGTLALS